MAGYSARADVKHFDSTRALFAPYGLTCEKWFSTEPMTRPDRHTEIEWNFLPEGSLTILLGGKVVEIPTGRLFSFWAARPHQDIEYRLTSPCFVVTIPLALFLRWHLPGNLAQALLSGFYVQIGRASCRERV